MSMRKHGCYMLLLSGLACLSLQAQSTVNVSTLPELREAVQNSNQTIVMKPGSYKLTDPPEGQPEASGGRTGTGTGTEGWARFARSAHVDPPGAVAHRPGNITGGPGGRAPAGVQTSGCR